MMPSRVDANQREIVKALRRTGAHVLHLHEVGNGCPDLMVGLPWSGENILLEIKSPGGKLTEAEQEFYDTWPGRVSIVWSVADALRAIGAVE